MLVGTFRQPTDPSRNDNGEVFMRDYTSQRWVEGQTPEVNPLGGPGQNGGIMPVVPHPTLGGEITVASNDFTTGVAKVTVAEHTVIAGLDFLIGADVNATAANLAAALDLFFDVEATSALAVVTVTVPYRPGPAALTAQHLGTIVNFTLNPASGELAPSAPQLEPPRF
jgi:hypothetical protein